MELLRATVITLSSIFTFAAIIPYLMAIRRGVTKPRLVTWGVWAFVLAIGGFAALMDRQIPAAALMLSTSVECGAVVLLGMKKGDRTIDRFDLICLAGAAAGLVLWLIFRSPAIAVSMTVLIDLSATLPTMRHAWRQPYEETLSTYILFTASNILTLFVVNFGSYTAAAYPVYDFLADLILAALLVSSPNRKPATGVSTVTPTRAPIFSRTATISSGAKTLELLTVNIGLPTWSINPVMHGQSTVLTVPVSCKQTGDLYCQYTLDSPGAKQAHWTQMESLGDGTFSAVVSGLEEGEYRVNIRAKCELGNWSNTETSLAVMAVHIQK